MRDILKYFNLKELSIATGISHNILRNYTSGRKAELSEEETAAIKKFIKSLGGM